MVQIVTSANRHNYERELLSMFEDRKRVFVDILKWNIPLIDGRYEIDDFDCEVAIYLIVSDPQGGHLGSMRLLPADQPHLLERLFPYLCADEIPVGPHTMEISRLCLSPSLRTCERFHIRNRLISAMTDYALANGITTLTGVVKTSFLAQILLMGWRCQVLGPAQLVEGNHIGAFRIDLDGDTIAGLSSKGIYVVEAPADDDPAVAQAKMGAAL